MSGRSAAVLYEMLTGKKPFRWRDAHRRRRGDRQATSPTGRRCRTGTPQRIRSLIARCLRKDPAQRLRDIADGRFQIEEALNDPGAF